MSAFFLIARLLFSAVFVIAPIQVVRSSALVAATPTLRRIPLARASVVAGSLTVIGAAVLVSLGIWLDLGALLIAAYLVAVTIILHQFWTSEDAGQAKENRDAFILNTSLLGGSLILFWAVNQSQHVPAALISTPLFGRW